MDFLAPPDGPEVAYEFYGPFAHVPDRYEWCRIRSPTHGAFDCFVVLRRPIVVYVSSEAGERFMKDRYPECETHRVGPQDLRIEERDQGRTVLGELRARAGPVRTVRMTLAAPLGVSRQRPYGGRGEPVWGSARWTCWGVDLELHGTATGAIEWAEGFVEPLKGVPCVVTMGSFGRIAPLG